MSFRHSKTAAYLLALTIALPFFLAAFPASAATAPKYNQQVIMGWVEHVYLPDLGGRLKAKLDTGATTSSMRAEVVNIVPAAKKTENESVVFQVEDAEGKTTTMQRKLVRWVRIKGKSGQYQRRPVVEMDFCVAGHNVRSEVNLAPRADFIYPVLVGRNMLRNAHIIVDPSRTFTAHARCPDMNANAKDDE